MRWYFHIMLVTVFLLSGCSLLQPEQKTILAEEAEAAQENKPFELPKVVFELDLPEVPLEDALTADTYVPPPNDLWQRLRDGFQLSLHDHPRVQAELRYFTGKQGYFDRVFDRGRPFLYYIVEEVEKNQMPMEVALLPVVESAFQPFAYSHGRAAGIWQFIPGTGRYYGMKQTWWYDGRRDVIAATDGAMRYLDRLYGMFDSWELALASYNSGEGTVLRQVRHNTRLNRPTGFFDLNLPPETQSYVPRLLAISEIVRHPEKYGIKLPPMPDEPQIIVVELDSQIDLALAAELAGVSVEEMYRLNPGFNRWATDPDGPHRLVIPLDRETVFNQRLAETPKEQRVKWARHQVREGETLSHIAHKYRTTVAMVRDINRLRGNTIRAGSYLLVPTASRQADSYSLSASQRQQNLKARDRDGNKHEYVVRAGDTLWDISRVYKVGVRELAKWNGMAPGDPLKPGKTLVIWTKAEVQPVANTRMTAAPIPKQQRLTYTVRSGDSLYVIAQRFRVTINELRKWNSLPSKGYLQPGQRLVVYVDVTRQHSSI